MKHDLVLDAGRPRARETVIDHRAASFVASLLQDALRGDVGHNVVAVAGHPGAAGDELLFQAERIVHDDLAAEGHEKRSVPEMPDLDGISLVRGGDGPSRLPLLEED